MLKCNDCRNCSWPDLVSKANTTLPDPWRAELRKIEEENQAAIPEAIWVAALLRWEAGDRDGSALDAIIGSVVDSDFLWADSALCRS